MDPVDGDQVYAAERLLEIRTRRGKQEYLVKWKGWSKKHNTWEPVENILDDRLIQEFEQSKVLKAPAPKRRSGAPPNTAATSSSLSPSGPPPAKRGRPATDATSRVKNERATESITSSIQTVPPRRSSRHSSAAKESRESSIVTTKQRESVPKLTEEKTVVDSATKKKEKKHEEKQLRLEKAQVKTIEDENKGKNTGGTKEPKVSETEQEISSKPQTEEKTAQNQEEFTKTANITPAIEETNNTTNETKKDASPPLEIFVERKFTEAAPDNVTKDSDKKVDNDASQLSETINNVNGNKNNGAYIITNETDPNCTHKIQVFTKQGRASAETEAETAAKQIEPVDSKTGKTRENNSNNTTDNVVHESNSMVKDSHTTEIISAVTETVSGGQSTNYSVEEGNKNNGGKNEMNASSTIVLSMGNAASTTNAATNSSE